MEARKIFKRQQKVLSFNWMEDTKIWFGRWDATHLLPEASPNCHINEVFFCKA
jgi:hypothetical protein